MHLSRHTSLTLALMSGLALPSFAAAQNPLPPLPVPAQNPITPSKSILGKLLFWEEQMSSNNRVACGTCHTFAAGGGDLRRLVNPGPDGITPSADDVVGSPGIIHSDASNAYLPDTNFGFSIQSTGRASPSFLTAAWFTDLFWDGRARTAFVDPTTGAMSIPSGGALESQSLGPLLSSAEMAHDLRSYPQLIQKLTAAKPMALATNLPIDMAAAIAGGTSYPDLFAAAFGTPAITTERIAFALATYERTLVPDQTPYDAFVAGNTGALTFQQQMGLNMFMGPARCNQCHTTGLFSDNQFRNLGLRPIGDDIGRQAVTGNPADAGRFKVPSLRNVGLRQSFMHTGQFTTLTQVVNFYQGGGGPNPQNRDPLLQPFFMPGPATGFIVDFMTNALTDPRVAQGLPPFDRPTLRSDLLGEAGEQYGSGSPGTGGAVPEVLAEVPANLGNVDFKLGVHNALGGAATTLVLSLSSASTTLGGANINVGLGGGELLISGVLQGTAGVGGDGYGSFQVPVPNVPGIAGVALFAQWFVWDGGAPGAAATTRGATVTLL